MACNVEAPADGDTVGVGALRIWGWSIPRSGPLKSVELNADGVTIARTRDVIARPDVSHAFPDCAWAATSGFALQVNLPLKEFAAGETVLEAVTSADERATLARVRLEAVPRDGVRAHRTDLGDLPVPPPTPDGPFDLTAEDALARLKSSPAMRWARLVDDEPPPGTAWQRLTAEDVFKPVYRPEFSIRPDDRIFAIGSCFARGVEGALSALGLVVESMPDVFGRYEVADGVIGAQRGFTNKYTTEAIRDELRWALVPDTEFPEEALVALGDGTWFDPHATPILKPGTKDETLVRHALLTSLTRKVRQCRIVVLTLGLIETFYDTRTRLYTNCTPPLMAEPDRFRFRVLDFGRVLDALEDIHGLLSMYGHPATEIVVTVSPVPLQATFTGLDVVVANTQSKAVLRAAAAEWVTRHANVHYFPSFEIVMNSSREAVWRRDGRHVRDEFVRNIMDFFVAGHLRDVPRRREAVQDARQLVDDWNQDSSSEGRNTNDVKTQVTAHVPSSKGQSGEKGGAR